MELDDCVLTGRGLRSQQPTRVPATWELRFGIASADTFALPASRADNLRVCTDAPPEPPGHRVGVCTSARRIQLRYLLRSCRRGRRQQVIHAERVRVGRVVHVFEAMVPEARKDRRVTLR